MEEVQQSSRFIFTINGMVSVAVHSLKMTYRFPGYIFPKLAQLRAGRFLKLLAWTPSINSDWMYAKVGSTSSA
jgi:hypothetical protein